MKLFHMERGKEVAYVQMQDIMYLTHETDMPIPASIFTKVFQGVTIVNDSNRFDFVKFSKEEEVNFFRGLDFIIDYNQYKDLSDKQLEEKWEELAGKANEIAEKWNSMTEDERKENSSLFDEHRNIHYMLKFITEVYAIKHGKRVMPFPKFVKNSKRIKKKKCEIKERF